MGYYQDLLNAKNARDYDEINKVYKEAKRIVDELRRKYREISGRERDDGNFLYSIIEEKGMPTDSGDKQKAKHAAGLLESKRRMSTVPRDWGNSKGETNMGYYADLIKEKKEKQNSIVNKGTFNKGTYTIDKTTGMFGRTVYIVHAHYEKGPSKDMTFGSDSFETLQDAQKYADRLNSKEEKQNYRETGKMEEFRYEIEDTKDIGGIFYRGVLRDKTNQIFFATEWDKSKDRVKRELQEQARYYSKKNSKEEKDNASVQDRFRYKGCMITILKKGENQYTFSIEQNGREEGSNKVYPSQDKAESEAKREVETVWNEAEKDNISDRAIAIAMSYLKDGWKDDKIKKEMMSQYKFSEVETLSALDFAKKSLHNSDEEKGYYAKLAEEKAERNNDKTFSLYGKNYSFGSDRQKNQQEFKKAQDDFNREYFKVKEEMDELQKELKSKRFKLDQQWNTFYSQVKGFLGL